MENFSPFTIEHLQVDQLDQFKPSASNYYLVFWWKNIPLGHIWLYNDPNTSDSITLRQKAADTIQKTIDYYASLQQKGDQSWKKYLLENDQEKLRQELHNIIPLQIGPA